MPIKMKKYIITISSIIIMVCLGGVYAWSVFVPPLKAEHGLSTAETQLLFGFTIAVFTIAMIFAGRLQEKRGPRLTASIGAIFFSSGYLLASISKGQIVLLLLGIGILSGAGIGFGYVCSLTTPIKWFPRYKGLITGISVAGFGGGAILLSYIVKFLLAREMPVLDIFRTIGIGYGMVVFLSALALSVPEDIKKERGEGFFNASELVKDRKLWALFFGMFAGTFAGLLVTGNLKPIGLSYGISDKIATAAISLLAVGNAAGRIIWGRLSDMLGGRRSIIAALLFLSVFTLTLFFGARYDAGFLLITFAIGLGFGANFVLFATEVSHIYGVHKVGTIYPFVFLSYGIAGIIGPIIGGWLFDIMQTYHAAIIISALICTAGAAVYAFLIPGRRDS
jgi:OFA family oxalate/formate antiporter-like MFS transporter